VGTGIGIWLFNGLIIGQGPLIASMVTYVFPLVALGWGIYDGDPPTWPQISAMAGVLAMVALVQFGSAAPAASIGHVSHAAVSTPEFCPAPAAGALLESGGEPE
jgi:drug/metabolite transporter (DMT)-like permease